MSLFQLLEDFDDLSLVLLYLRLQPLDLLELLLELLEEGFNENISLKHSLLGCFDLLRDLCFIVRLVARAAQFALFNDLGSNLELQLGLLQLRLQL